jgi:hypothetical protein
LVPLLLPVLTVMVVVAVVVVFALRLASLAITDQPQVPVVKPEIVAL